VVFSQVIQLWHLYEVRIKFKIKVLTPKY